MAKINFTTNSKDRKMAATPAKYRESKGRPNISQSDGIRPAFPLMPFAHLPVSFTDVTTTDNVVIPKGRIVSAITSNGGVSAGGDMDGSVYHGVGKGIMGLVVPANGGTARAVTSPVDNAAKTISANAPIGIVEHDVYQDINGDNLNYDMRNKNWGVLAQQLIKIPSVDTYEFDKFYGEVGKFLDANTSGSGTELADEDIAAVGVDYAFTLANGDGTHGNIAFADWKKAGVDGQSYSSITKVEIGVDADNLVEQAVTTNYTVNSSGLINIQVVHDDAGAAAGDGPMIMRVTYVYDLLNVDTEGATAAATGNGYAQCEKEFSFLTYNSETGQGKSGMLVQPDFYGNYEFGGTTKTVQTVGTLMGVDFRFGKDMLDTVQSKWEDNAAYATAGTRTKGIPQFLYDFAYKALEGALIADGNVAWDTKWPGKDAAVVIKEAVDAGVFGEAWIQVNI